MRPIVNIQSGISINLIEIDTNSLYFCFRNPIYKGFLSLSIIYFSRIYGYSTVDLSDSVVFIGGKIDGIFNGNIVAKFDGNEWSRLPDLKQGRYSHGSIQINSKTFIIGGETDDDKE